MNDEIKVGDYIRTVQDGIRKVSYIDKDFVYVKDFYEDLDGAFTRDNIIKHSPNIIDLIEENDYVNGCLVLEKPYKYFAKTLISLDTQQAWGWGVGQMPIEHLETIVTKEQFEKIMYRVEE